MLSWTLCLLLLLLLLLLQGSDAMIGGQDARPRQFPFQVLVEGVGPNVVQLAGTGALIHPEWVLTTAESVAGLVTATVTLGVVLRNSTEADRQDIAVLRRYLHPGWTGRVSWENMHINDIALLRLASEARLSDAVQIAYLSRNNKWSFGNDVATVGGWGLHKTDRGYRTQNSLKWEETTTVGFFTCYMKRLFVSQLTGWVKPTHICADTKGEGPCTYDGGAPLVHVENGKPVVVGIFTTPITYYQFCDTKYPSVYTRVSAFLEWIKQVSGVSPP